MCINFRVTLCYGLISQKDEKIIICIFETVENHPNNENYKYVSTYVVDIHGYIDVVSSISNESYIFGYIQIPTHIQTDHSTPITYQNYLIILIYHLHSLKNWDLNGKITD